MFYNMLKHPASFKVIELLFMILMESTQVEAQGGRNNTLCVNNDKLNLIYHIGISKITNKMLEHWVQQMIGFVGQLINFLCWQVKQTRESI